MDDPGPAPMRRLTRFEYGRSLADLTGVDPSVAQALPPDEETMDFDDIAVAYSVSALHAEGYLEVAEQAATAAARGRHADHGVAGCDPTGGDATCVAAFIGAFGRRAWRRAMTGDEQQAMVQLYGDTASPGPTDGARRRGGRHAAGAAVPLPARAARGHLAAARRLRAGDAPRLPADRRGARRDAAGGGRARRPRDRDRPPRPDRSPAGATTGRRSCSSTSPANGGRSSRSPAWTRTGRSTATGPTPPRAALAQETSMFLTDAWQQRADADGVADRAGDVRGRVAGRPTTACPRRRATAIRRSRSIPQPGRAC